MTGVIGPVVSVSWWQQHRDEVVLADVRWYLDGRSGRDAYGAGHLPGAVFVDLDRVLAAEPSPEAGRHPLPDPATFAGGMAGLGIADDTTVVAYDDAGGTVAARLVWMLRATGHAAALLDGGLPVYRGPLEQAPPERAAAPGDVHAPPLARGPARRPRRRRRSGPQSSSMPATGCATAATASRSTRAPGTFPAPAACPAGRTSPRTARFSPSPELRERLAEAGVTDAAQVVSYCGSGVTACHNLLVLEHAGLGEGRLYPGSWSQYSHTTLPAALGDAFRNP